MRADSSRISPEARAEAYRRQIEQEAREEQEEIERQSIEEADQEFASDEPTIDEPIEIGDNGKVYPLPTTPVVRASRVIPPPVAPRPAPARNTGLVVEPISTFDVDRLWDWIRQDGDRGATFLGREFEGSLALQTFIQHLSESEAQGLAIARSVHYANQHIGFLMLSPILAPERITMLHSYLRPDMRDRGDRLLANFVSIAEQLASGFKLAIPSPDVEWAAFHKRVLGPLGFVPHTLFVR